MTAMITREMVIEKLSEMFKHPVEFPIYKNGSLELTKHSVGRIDVYRKTRILPMQDSENSLCLILILYPLYSISCSIIPPHLLVHLGNATLHHHSHQIVLHK